MKKNILLILIIFMCSFCFSQKAKTTHFIKTPVSIYTSLANIGLSHNTFYTTINNKVNFKKEYHFVWVSFEDIDSGRFLISDDNLTTKPTKFIYDDYKSYRDENLLKGFLQKHDLTRWNFCNFRQPHLN